MSDLYKFVNGTELDPIYICDPDKNKRSCKGSELCYKPGGCFYTTNKNHALDPSTPLYMAKSLIKVNKGISLDKLRAELHATAELHDDGDYYLRDEWIDEYFDEYKDASNTEQEPIGHCKDCKFFEYDSIAKVDEIPLIVAHEICNKWGDGCKSKEDGYCFLFEQQERSDHEST